MNAPAPVADWNIHAAALKAAAAESCDRLKAVWANVYADRALFGENLWTSLELLKNELKAKCQRGATTPEHPIVIETAKRAAAANSRAEWDAVLGFFNDENESLTDAEYKQGMAALDEARIRLAL